MIRKSTELSYEQAHDVYAAFVAVSSRKGQSQAEVFGRLSLKDRDVVVRAFEVVAQNKDRLVGTQAVSSTTLPKDLMALVDRLKGSLKVPNDQKLAEALETSKPIMAKRWHLKLEMSIYKLKEKVQGAIKGWREGKEATKASEYLGLDSTRGLYKLGLLSKKLVKTSVFHTPPKPTDQEIQFIAALALAGNKEAKELLDDLVVQYRSKMKDVPALISASEIVKGGAPLEGRENDALLYYQSAFNYLVDERNVLMTKFEREHVLDQDKSHTIIANLQALSKAYKASDEAIPQDDKFKKSMDDLIGFLTGFEEARRPTSK